MAKPRLTFKAAKQKAAKVQAKPRNDVVYLKTKRSKVVEIKGQSLAQDPNVGGVQFPIGDDEYRIDVTYLAPYVYKVFYWAERPDAIYASKGNEYHWHPDSEHSTIEAAQQRMADLRGGAKKKSILLR